MIIQPIKTGEPSFGWTLDQKFTRYGNTLNKLTDYKPDNGRRLVILEEFKNGQKVRKTSILFGKSFQVLGRKVIEYIDNKISKVVKVI